MVWESDTGKDVGSRAADIPDLSLPLSDSDKRFDFNALKIQRGGSRHIGR